ncbi:MAG: hypothetical protein M0Z89_04595 [Nitrospiraceae bacterium]|nr:hypothetical protein [Nitrospiraceae bacterium]
MGREEERAVPPAGEELPGEAGSKDRLHTGFRLFSERRFFSAAAREPGSAEGDAYVRSEKDGYFEHYR